MTYDQIRPLIKTGDLLAWSHSGWGSWHAIQVSLVRMFTQSEFSHVGLAFVVYDRIFVLEAVSSGVRIYPLSRALPFYLVSNPKELSTPALEWAFQYIGNEYESKWRMVLATFIDIDLKNNHRFQCSEYVNGILTMNDQEITVIDTPSAIVEAAMQHWGSLQYITQ